MKLSLTLRGLCSISLSCLSYSVSAPVCDAATPSSADAPAAGRGAAERPLSLPQHQTGQRTGQCVSAHRPRVQQVQLDMNEVRHQLCSGSSESASIVLIPGSTLD